MLEQREKAEYLEKKIAQAHKIATGLWEKGAHDEGDKYRKAARAGRGIIAEVTPQFRWFISEDEIRPRAYAFYPSPEHAKKFAEGITGVRPHGPAQFFPGAVGSLMVTDSPRENGGLVVNYVQGHFRQEATGAISRGLASKYGGWRKRLLEHLFETAEEKKIVFPIRLKQNVVGEIIKAAKKHGFELTAAQAGRLVLEKK